MRGLLPASASRMATSPSAALCGGTFPRAGAPSRWRPSERDPGGRAARAASSARNTATAPGWAAAARSRAWRTSWRSCPRRLHTWRGWRRPGTRRRSRGRARSPRGKVGRVSRAAIQVIDGDQVARREHVAVVGLGLLGRHHRRAARRRSRHRPDQRCSPGHLRLACGPILPSFYSLPRTVRKLPFPDNERQG